MESTWGLAIFMWSVIIIVFVVCLVCEWCKTPEQRKAENERAHKRWEKERLSRTIVEVTPLGVSGTQFKRGGVKGALFGGFIGGVPGAVAGAALRSGKGVPVESFAVKYGDGRVVIRQCMQGSSEYKALMKYVVK